MEVKIELYSYVLATVSTSPHLQGLKRHAQPELPVARAGVGDDARNYILSAHDQRLLIPGHHHVGLRMGRMICSWVIILNSMVQPWAST